MGLLGGYAETEEERRAIDERDRQYMEAESFADRIGDLERELRETKILVWAMVRAAGGSLVVHQSDLAMGMPENWRVDDVPAENGLRFSIGKLRD